MSSVWLEMHVLQLLLKFELSLTYKALAAVLILLCLLQGSNVDLLYPGFVVAVSVIITLLCTIWLPIGAAVEFVQSLLLSKRNPKVGADHLENGNHTEKNGKINGAFEEERSESNQGENFSSKEENAASSTSSRL